MQIGKFLYPINEFKNVTKSKTKNYLFITSNELFGLKIQTTLNYFAFDSKIQSQ